MPFAMVRLKPGVNVESTPSLSEAALQQSNLIRFRAGLPEKLGGWDKFFNFAVGGVPKALHAWQDLNEQDYLGVGSTTVLGAIANNTLVNITPQQKTTNFAPNFSTTISTPNVVVVDSNVTTITSFDSVEFKTPISVGGLILSGAYPIDLFLGAGQYRIIAAANATSSVANGGAVPVFDTTSGSATVTVTLNNHGLLAGGSITFPITTSVGGITILGTYQAVTITSGNIFTIAGTNLASSTATVSMNSGQTQLLYYIALGPVATSTGYSVGTYSSGAYSTGSATTAQTGTAITATDWTLDNWGQTFLACPDAGGIYAWTPNAGFQNAQLVATAPIYNAGLFVSMQTQMLICYGSTEDDDIGVDQDPLLIKWSDVGDYTSFAVSTTSQAGSRRLSTGSKIVGGMSAPQQELIWTDLGLWSMNYLGSLQAGVWGFNQIGWSCGLIGKHAAARLGSSIFWMSGSNFFALIGGGAPQVIPCPVWDVVFQDLNTTYQAKSWAWANTPFNEVWFFYPRASTNATEPDAFVKYNTVEGEWDYGPMDRTCGIDQSIVGMPIAATSGGIIYEHEVSADADGQAINAWFMTGLYQLSDGEEMLFVDWGLPDFIWQLFGSNNPSATLLITIYAYDYLSSAPVISGPHTVTSSTPYFNPRVRGRFFALRVESNDIGSFWRLGGCRFRLSRDGRL